jgi:hypothetical protein
MTHGSRPFKRLAPRKWRGETEGARDFGSADSVSRSCVVLVAIGQPDPAERRCVAHAEMDVIVSDDAKELQPILPVHSRRHTPPFRKTLLGGVSETSSETTRRERECVPGEGVTSRARAADH